jgi:hypothetical protein
MIMCAKRTKATELRMMADQSVGANVPFGAVVKPVGHCIQLLLIMIQKADRLVPAATMMQASM